VRRRVDEVKEQCGLIEEGRGIIGHLSKGYRQRVGLADALIHEPELLILDEPTIGLDPEQIRQVRDLIGQLSERHTILLSTHILPEVEMTCQRVLIINHGRIVASDTPDRLRDRMLGGTRVVTEIHAPVDEVFEQLNALPHVQRVRMDKGTHWSRYRVDCSKDVDLRQNVFELVVRRGWKMRELSLEKESLEDVFVSLIRNGDEQDALAEPAPVVVR
jgi:ABC-2 type transport system ATP-binding protein